MRIHAMTKGDFDQVLTDLADFWGNDRTAPFHHPLFLYEFGDMASVIRDGDRVLAYCLALYLPSRHLGYIHLVGVRISHQGQGLGRLLYESIASDVRQRGGQALKAITTPQNRASIAFHRQLGFDLTGDQSVDGIPVVRDYSGPGQDRVVFHKSLAGLGGHTLDPVITFRSLAETDLNLLHDWLSRPHVIEWWEAAPSLAEVQADYLPRLASPDVRALDATSGVVQYIAYEGDDPVAYVQAYRVMAHQAEGWWLDEIDPHALGTDQFIGLSERLGQGLGTRMMRAFTAFLFEDPRVTSIQSDPDPANGRAIACLRKAGFREIGIVETLDGPALLMRITRPGPLSVGI